MPGPHQIDAITPNHGPIGTVVTITGSGFGATQGTSFVRFSPAEIAVINSWSAVSVECIVPAAAITGQTTIVVAGEDALSPRNADHWHTDELNFPAGPNDDFEFQNTTNDSDVGGLDDLLLADARDLNRALELLVKLRDKVGIDGSADPTSLDFKLLGPADPISIEEFDAVQAGAAGPVFPPPPPVGGGGDFEPPGSGLFPVRVFPAGADFEMQFALRVPRKVSAGSVLEIRPVFVLRAPPGAGEVVTLELFGDLDGVALPPLASPGNVLVDPFAPGLPFVTLPAPLRSIPVDGAPPFAAPDAEVVLRFQRLVAGNTYAGDLALYKILVDWTR